MVPIFKMLTIGLLPSCLKKMYYRMQGAKIGKNVSLGIFSFIKSNSIEIGDGTKISPLNFIDVKKLKLGKRVEINMLVAIRTGELEIDNDSMIMEQVFIGGIITPESKLTIGKRVKVFPYSIVNPTKEIVIGDDAAVGFSNYIFTHGSWQSKLDGFPITFGPVTIGKGVWLPPRVQIMANVTVGDYATIGAGTIINKDIPPRSLAVGVPAKVIKSGDEYIKNFTLEEKDQIVKDILREFSRYLNYEGITSKVHETETFLIEISSKPKYKLVYAKKIETVPQEQIVISLSKMEESLTQQLTREKKIWFDLEGKRTHFDAKKMWTNVRKFFSRYGIRFEIES